jgi:TP901 family phage tail tape measure protein
MPDKRINIAVILSADNKMTAVIGNSVNKSISQLQKFQAAANKLSSQSFDISKKAAVTGAVISAPLVAGMSKAIEFEDKMADVAKVMNTQIGSKQFNILSQQSLDISEHLGSGANSAADLMASLGEGGVEQSFLKKVSIDAGEAAVAFSMASDAAGDAYVKIHNALNIDWKQTKSVGDAINFLSNTQASSASQLLGYMSAGGAGVARSSKMTGAQSAAFGSYLISVGKSDAESATIMERAFKGVMKNTSLRNTFLQNGQGASGFLAVLQRGANIKNSTEQFKYFAKFGEYGNDIRLMAKNMGQVRASVNSVADAEKYAGSVHQEFMNRNSTTKGQMNLMWASAERAMLDFMTTGLPVLNDFLKAIKPILHDIGIWIKANPELARTILKVVAGAAALSFTISAASAVFGAGAKAFSVLSKAGSITGRVILLLGQGALIAGSAIKSLVLQLLVRGIPAMASFAVAAAPVIVIVAGIATAIYLAYAAYKLFTDQSYRDARWNDFKLRMREISAVISGLGAVMRVVGGIALGFGKTVMGSLTFNPALIREGITDAANAYNDLKKKGGFGAVYNSAYGESMRGGAPALKNNAFATPVKPRGNSVNNTFAPVINMAPGSTGKEGDMIAESLKPHFLKWMKEHQQNLNRLSYSP